MTRWMLAAFVGMALLVGCNRQPTVPTTPFADFRNDSLCFFTSASDPGHLNLQYIFEFGDGQSDTTSSRSSGETAYCPHTFADTGVFSVRARARNERGALSGWSDPFSYCASQQPTFGDTSNGWGEEPYRWRLEHWATNRWRYFVLDVGDPDGDSVSVKFLWGDGRSTEWSSFTASGRVTDSVKFDTAGEYYVRLLLRDHRGTLAGPDTVVRLRVTEVSLLWYTLDDYSFDEDLSPALRDVGGRLLVYAVCGNAGDEVSCFDSRGWLVWDEHVGGIVYSAPSLSQDGSRLYVPTNGGLVCLAADRGNLIWTVMQGEYIASTPSVGPNGHLYLSVSSDSLGLACVCDHGDAAEVLWRLGAHGDPSSPVVADDGTVYAVVFGLTSGCRPTLVAANPSGQVLWCDSEHLADADEEARPVIDSRGRVLVAGDGLCCFNQDGTLAWQQRLYFYPGSIIVGAQDRIFLLDDEYCLLYCLDSAGAEVWRCDGLDMGLSPNSPCLASDGSVVITDPEAEYVWDISADGDMVFEYSLYDSTDLAARRTRLGRDDEDGSSAVIGPDGNAYLVSGEFGLCAFALGDRTLAKTAWPTYNHDPARSGWAGRRWP